MGGSKRRLENGLKKGDEEEVRGQKGVMSDSFTRGAVVLTAPAKMKGGGELQLSSMVARR